VTDLERVVVKKSDDSQEFRIRGMDCAEEVAVLKREIGPVVGGVDRLVFDILKGKMTVLAGTASVNSKLVIDSVQRTGMRAEAWADPVPGAADGDFWQRRGRTILTIVSGTSLIAAFLTHGFLVGDLWKALGSEGMGISHACQPCPSCSMPWPSLPVRGLCFQRRGSLFDVSGRT
jgi:copper chaperone CopZ